MAVLGLVLHGHAGGALPHRVIPAIIRCMPGYLIGIASLTVISLLVTSLQELADLIPYAGALFGWLLTICLMVMQGRLTGTLGLRFARRITGV
jgi:predicted PurR-regulated permease PerM